MIKSNYEKQIRIIILCIVFVGIFIFYIKHPLYVFNVDDWTYISYKRLPIPDWRFWNPTRIFPEVIFPIISKIGVFAIYPFMGDYIESIALAFAFSVAVFIIVYFAMAAFLIDKMFSLNITHWTLVFVIFVIYHFINDGNGEKLVQYILYGLTLTNTVYYILSSLINAALVLYLMQYDKPLKFELSWKLLLVAIWVYFAINSNMYSSIILISYTLTRIIYELSDFLKIKKEERKLLLRNFFHEYYMLVVILAIYAISLVMEAKGGRSDSLSSGGIELFLTCSYFAESIVHLTIWLLPLLLVIGGALIILKINQNQSKDAIIDIAYKKMSFICGLSSFISVVFLILLSSKVTPSYIKSPKILFSWLFWVLLWALFSLCYLVKRIKQIMYTLPVALLIMCYIILCSNSVYVSSYDDTEYISNDNVKKIDNYIIKEAQSADAQGIDYVEVKVPVFNEKGNWPLNTEWGGERIATSLYKHGLTKNYVEIKLVEDAELNEKFNIVIGKK